MATDHSLQIRQAVVLALRGVSEIEAVVSGRIYGEASPAKPVWPFIKVGAMVAGPFDATCLSGSETTFVVNCFVKGLDGSGAYNLAKLVQQALDGLDPALAGGAHMVSLDWTGSTPLKDQQEADGYYSAVAFRAVTSDDF